MVADARLLNATLLSAFSEQCVCVSDRITCIISCVCLGNLYNSLHDLVHEGEAALYIDSI